MSRVTPSSFRQAAFAQETGEAFLILVTINVPEPVRLCNNGVNITSRGNLYLAFPFELGLPQDMENQPPRARITIDNISREMVASIRTVNTPVPVTLEVITASDPDVVVAAYENLQLTNVRYDALVVEGDLSLDNYLLEPFPGGRFSPGNFPGLF